jgi:predicted nucleic acid-binding protein
MLDQALERGDTFALTSQVLLEFVHVVTDVRRFDSPLSMGQALERAEFWWKASDVVQLFPTEQSTVLFLEWMRRYKLGRKRILDTMLAAIFHSSGIHSVYSTNTDDFSVFGCFSVSCPGKGTGTRMPADKRLHKS